MAEDQSMLSEAVKNAPVVRLTYPYSDRWDYQTFLEKIDLDKERINDIKTGKGFIIETSRNVKIDIKNQTGIFSSRYGSTMADTDSFNGKYRCKCGLTKGSIMHGETCPVCGTIVKFYDDDVSIFGWLVLKGQNYVIHPNMYRVLEGFIGESRMNAIIQPIVDVDSDGKIINIGSSSKTKKDPFRGIGLYEFKERYDEIIDYYYEKHPAKKLFYDELKSRKDIVFTQSIPVFSALLRPSILEGNNTLKYQSVNEHFMMLSKLVQEINRQTLGIDRKVKEKLSLIYDAQVCVNAVYEEIKNCLAKKKGDLRGTVGGRYSFTSRSVIRQDPYLRQNHIRLPFAGLMELLQQIIINVLVRTHNISYSQAYKWWFKALVSGYDQTIYDIVDGLIKDQGGLPIIINRNPKHRGRY